MGTIQNLKSVFDYLEARNLGAAIIGLENYLIRTK